MSSSAKKKVCEALLQRTFEKKLGILSFSFLLRLSLFWLNYHFRFPLKMSLHAIFSKSTIILHYLFKFLNFFPYFKIETFQCSERFRKSKPFFLWNIFFCCCACKTGSRILTFSEKLRLFQSYKWHFFQIISNFPIPIFSRKNKQFLNKN